MTANSNEPGRFNDPVSEWYALSTEPRRERTATAFLAERGISVFLPMEADWAMERGKITSETALAPLFPGYVFVLLEMRQMPEVLGVEGVSGFVTCVDRAGEQRPFPIPAQAIIGLQVAERAGAFDRRVDRKPAPYRPKKGDRVQVTAGPYLTYVGTVLAAPKKNRVQVRLEDGPSPMLKVSQVSAA